MVVEMLESILAAFYTLDAAWRFTCINKAAEQYLLHSVDELIGRSHWDVFPHLRGTEIDVAFQRAVVNQAAVSLEDWHDVAHDRWFDARISPVAEGLAVSFHDVTPRKQACDALRQCEERYRHIVEATQEGIWHIDAEDRTVFVNQKVAAMRGPERLSLIADLRRDIVQDELRLHYQPKVNLATGRVCGFEALVRWMHPTRGMIGPDQFIPLAEQTGLIAPLARWVLEAALHECQRHQALGLHTSVAVNLSAANLHDCELPGMVARLLQTYVVPAQCLRIEVTESILAGGTRAIDVLTQLAALGIPISVDDFGTGHSSLAYLKRLPVDELKIDKTFIQHMCEDETDVAIVASTIGLAHSLGLQIVAEGVEDRATWDLLVRLGCDVAQGYYCSRPMPVEQLTQWLRSSPWAAA
jgi:PAS domain S-box-containing protein